MLLAKNTPVILARSTKPLENAAVILRRDLEAALEESFLSSGSIMVRIPEEENPLDESYRIDVTDDDIKIMAASSLGGVYGLLRVSEQFLGVAPFWFWADLPPAKAGMVEAPCGVYHSGPFNVRFRGWFLNDEVLLSHWKPYPADPDFVWKMAFETLLRCGGNMVIPGTDYNSLKNRQLAAETGCGGQDDSDDRGVG